MRKSEWMSKHETRECVWWILSHAIIASICSREEDAMTIALCVCVCVYKELVSYQCLALGFVFVKKKKDGKLIPAHKFSFHESLCLKRTNESESFIFTIQS